MRRPILSVFGAALLLQVVTNDSFAQNPIVTDQFTADPAARVFGDTIYLYPSHDIPPTEKRGRVGWFCMEDYHVFSSSNLTDWMDRGVIVSQDKVPWVNSKSYAMWAPDCIDRHGKYYFYFPAPARDSMYGRGFSIGVAIADRPYGPFTPQPEPIKGVHGIDPNPLVDRDGQVYLYWAARNIYVAKLKENMLELAGEPTVIEGLPAKGLKEGPFAFERNGIYYLTYPHVEDSTERLEYATSDKPTGPFKVTGVLMDAIPGCWTNQPSVVEFRNQWYLFYHFNDLSPRFDKNRSVRIDSLFFNNDGTIRRVIPTLRGVGITASSGKIRIGRYSARSAEGASIDFIDTLDTFKGWKTMLDEAGAWIQYNAVDFRSKNIKLVEVRTLSKTGGTLQITVDQPDGPEVAEVSIPRDSDWTTVRASVLGIHTGVHNLIVRLKEKSNVEIEWLSFE